MKDNFKISDYVSGKKYVHEYFHRLNDLWEGLSDFIDKYPSKNNTFKSPILDYYKEINYVERKY